MIKQWKFYFYIARIQLVTIVGVSLIHLETSFVVGLKKHWRTNVYKLLIESNK